MAHSESRAGGDGKSALSFDATRPIEPLDASRFAQTSGNFVAGQIQLDSQRFMQKQS